MLVIMFALSVMGLAQTSQAAKAGRFRRPARLPMSKFYDPPALSTSAKPGTLIRSERTYDYSLSADVATVRILYYSRSASGDPVAVSAVVIVPERTAPAGGWPIIAWAHGVQGVARDCAPSLRDNLDEGSFFSMYINLGYAVVATDYAGLGTSSRNAYVDLQSNAADVIYSVAAARSAVPELGSRWLAMGISEGGLAAAGVAELEDAIHDSNYLGSVALSGIIDDKNLLGIHGAQASLLGPAFLAYGIKTVFPPFQVADILTEKALVLYHQAETSCGSASPPAETTANRTLKPYWQQNEFVRRFVERNTLGQRPAFRPLLVLASETDPATPIALTTQAVERLCKQGDRVQLYRYESPNPKAVIGDSVRDQIGWIQARFANQPAPSNCP